MVSWTELFLVMILGLYAIAMGWYYRHIKTVRLDFLSAIAGLLVVIAPFLPWVSIDGAISMTIFEQLISSSFTGALNLPGLIELSGTISPFLQQYAPEYAIFVDNLRLGCILAIILLVLAGITAFLKGVVGGFLSLVGIILFTVVGGNLHQSVTLSVGYIYTSLSIGYFMAWAGCLIGFASHFYHRKKKVPRSHPLSSAH